MLTLVCRTSRIATACARGTVLTGFFNGRRSWQQCSLGTTNAVHGAVSTQQPILLDGGTITRVKFRREPPPLSGMPIEFLDDVSNERCLAIVAEDTHPRHLFVRGADGIAACIKRRQVTLVFPRKCTIEDLCSMAESTSPQIEHFELLRARNAWQWLYERHGNGAAICYDGILDTGDARYWWHRDQRLAGTHARDCAALRGTYNATCARGALQAKTRRIRACRCAGSKHCGPTVAASLQLEYRCF